MGKLDELKKIRDMHTLKLFLKENKDFLKKITFPVVVAIAVIFFWLWGNQNEGTIIEKLPDEEQIQEETEGVQKSAEEEITDGAAEVKDINIYIDIGGEVAEPGVYQVKQGTRLFQVIEKAGGLTETADTDGINQAETVTDGQKIIIGSIDPKSPYYGQGLSQESGDSGNAVQEGENGVCININLGNSEELQQIPGVGPVTASKIIEYRETNGPFLTKEDIKNVSGIGDKTYESMKDYICV